MVFMNYLILMKRSAFVLCQLVILLTFSACSRQPSYAPAPQNGTDIVIELAGLGQDTPKFYTYRFRGKNINFFVCKVQDRVQSFLDACASCYTHKRGYSAGGGQVTCRECGTQFSLNQLEKGLGGCYPIKLEGRVEDGRYRIPIAELEAAASKF